MKIEENIIQLLEATLQAHLFPDGEIISADELSMPGVGYSGAALRRFEVQYASINGQKKRVSFVIKDASLVERRTLLHLHRQGHRCIPFSYTFDLEQDNRMPVCMEYIGGAPGKVAHEDLERVAEMVAGIHAANMQNPTLKEWLPPSDGTFIESGYVLGTFRKSWKQALADTNFKKEYGSISSDLETAARKFQRDVEELWRDGKTITLIHGDLHDGNVVVNLGQPFIVDWDQARCGSLYLDLPNLFPDDDASIYYKALMQYGIGIDEQEFFKWYKKMGRYVGFKYMGFVLSHWAFRNEQGSWVRGSLENLIDLALNGAKTPDM